MPRVFVYEFMTAGGLFHEGTAADPSLTSEGEAMLEAVAADFSGLPNVELSVMRDVRIDLELDPRTQCEIVTSGADEIAKFNQLVEVSDYVLVVAPETGQWLERRSEAVPKAKLLSPDVEFVRVTSNKWRTFQALNKFGVPVPMTFLSNSALSNDKTWILKPIDGAGSQGIERLCESTQPQLDRLASCA